LLSSNLRDAIRSGKPVSGCTISGFAPEQVEVLGLLGYDFAFLDSEHWPLSDRELSALITAGDAVGIASLVRIRENSHSAIQRVMDSGAAGIIVPDVSSARRAQEAILSVKYQPQGNRGLSSVRASGYGIKMGLAEYTKYANDKSIVVCQVETMEGVRNIDEIVKIDLIDAIFIGTTDLSNSLGYTGQYNHEKVSEAVQLIENKTKTAGKNLASMVRGDEDPGQYIARGYCITVASGMGLFTSGAKKYINAMRNK